MEKHPSPQMGTEGDAIGARLIAFILDMIILGVVAVAITLPLAFLGEAGFYLSVIVVGAVAIVYVYLLEGMYGYTPGKYLMGLVVVKSDGSPCTIGASILRNLLLIVDQLPFAYLIGLGLIVFTDRNQRVGDFVGDTVVVKRQ